VLDLDAFERCNKAEGLGVSDGTSQAKNLEDTDNTCKLFRFLQLLCEGHNLGMISAPHAIVSVPKRGDGVHLSPAGQLKDSDPSLEFYLLEMAHFGALF